MRKARSPSQVAASSHSVDKDWHGKRRYCLQNGGCPAHSVPVFAWSFVTFCQEFRATPPIVSNALCCLYNFHFNSHLNDEQVRKFASLIPILQRLSRNHCDKWPRWQSCQNQCQVLHQNHENQYVAAVESKFSTRQTLESSVFRALEWICYSNAKGHQAMNISKWTTRMIQQSEWEAICRPETTVRVSFPKIHRFIKLWGLYLIITPNLQQGFLFQDAAVRWAIMLLDADQNGRIRFGLQISTLVTQMHLE